MKTKSKAWKVIAVMATLLASQSAFAGPDQGREIHKAGCKEHYHY
jgi:hypothetical protein